MSNKPLFKDLAIAGEKVFETILPVVTRTVENIVANLAANYLERATGSGGAAPKSPSSESHAAAKRPSTATCPTPVAQSGTVAAQPHRLPTHEPHEPYEKSGATPSKPEIVGFGSHGAAVAELQRDLGITVDGIDGPQTTAALEAFQRDHGLKADGIAGTHTWAELKAEPVIKAGSQADAVRAVQRQLGVRADGIDNAQTTAAIKKFQRSHGLVPDGIVGTHTWQALDAAERLSSARSDRPRDGSTPASHPPHASTAGLLGTITPAQQPAGVSIGSTPNGSSAIAEVSAIFNEIADVAFRDDWKTLTDPKSSDLERAFAAADLVTNFVDPAKAGSEIVLKTAAKELGKPIERAVVSEAESLILGTLALGSKRHAPDHSSSAPTMHIRYAGEDREFTTGFRQSGIIESVQNGIVTQNNGRTKVEYDMSRLIANAVNPATVREVIVPGNNVQVSISPEGVNVIDLGREHERHRQQQHQR